MVLLMEGCLDYISLIVFVDMYCVCVSFQTIFPNKHLIEKISILS